MPDEPDKKEEVDESLPWDEATSQEWADAVKGWDWAPGPNESYIMEGPCPRCKHPMYKKLAGGMTFVTAPEPVNVLCNCSYPHKDRPEDRTGCGQSTKVPRP